MFLYIELEKLTHSIFSSTGENLLVLNSMKKEKTLVNVPVSHR